MFLDSNRKLVAVLTAAKTTLDLSVTGDYVDITTTATTPGPINTYTNGVTAVDIVPAPAASTIRKLNGLEIYGRDTAAKTVRTYTVDSTPTTGLLTAGSFVVGYDYQIVSVGTTNFTLIGASANTVGVIFTATGVGTGTGTAATAYQHVDLQLQIDDSLGYTDVQGWYTIDSQGNLKSVQAASATAIASAIHGATDKATPVGADELGLWDSVTGLLNKVSFTNLLTWIKAQLTISTGTWTATLTASGTAPTTPITVTGTYVRRTGSVLLKATFTNVDTTGASGQLQITGSPFTATSISLGHAGKAGIGTTSDLSYMSASSTTINLVDTVTLGITNIVAGAGKYVWIQIEITA